MKTQMKLIFTLLILFSVSKIHAQTPIIEEVFTDVSVQTGVNYAQNYTILTGSPNLQDLSMDVYTPTGDASTDRPLMILMHAGSFIPKGLNTLPLGDKGDSTIVEMCKQYAKRGWTCASIGYRLGWTPTATDQEDRAKTIIQAVYRANQDARAAIRFFREDAENGNQFGIDPYRVAIGGSNSGGYVALTVGSLNKPEELELFKFLDDNGAPFVDPDITGGIWGEGGASGVNRYNTPGYSSAVQIVKNLGGAVGDSSWIESGEAPIVAFHGVGDPLTPYGTQVVIVASTGDAIVEVSGSLDVIGKSDEVGNQDIFYAANFTDDYTLAAQAKTALEGLFPFNGVGFEPWAWYDCGHPSAAAPTGAPEDGCGSAANPMQTKAMALNYIDTIMNYFAPRAVVAFENIDSVAVETADPIISSVRNLNVKQFDFNTYPNPASDYLILENNNSEIQISNVGVYALDGTLVKSSPVNGNSRLEIGISDLPKGIYVLRVEVKNKGVDYHKFIKQ
ncbi:MAG: T9SS C-terminal target domain-containing protein [Chitinophagaceae bacterium]|nr:MAG: T9SS C-terminal target domain-containing protein [Chitinophagaceae bacterium]